MGRVKEMMMDWDFGIMHTFDKDKYVCTKHFDDPYLNEYIQENAHKETCSYCGAMHTKVLDMRSFMHYINERLSQRLCPLDDANLPLSSSFYDDEEEEIKEFVSRDVVAESRKRVNQPGRRKFEASEKTRRERPKREKQPKKSKEKKSSAFAATRIPQ